MSSLYFAGIAGVHLPTPAIDLGDGLRLEQTYAHLFAPYMMAFQPALPGAAHPAPWRAVSSGFTVDIYCQLLVTGDHTPEGLSIASEKAWLIATLLRVIHGPSVRAAVIASSSISIESAEREVGELWAFEVVPSPLLHGIRTSPAINDDQLTWLCNNWRRAWALSRSHNDFKVLLEAYSSCSWAKSSGLALVELWGAIQRLFTQSHQEASLRLSTLVASYLEPPGIERRRLAERVSKLYGVRSHGAHGGREQDLQPLADSANIAARVITRLTEHQAVPTRDDLFDMLYGV